MAEDYRRLAEEVAQGILLDDPGFLKEIVERVLQEVLEAEMTEHVGAAPYERSEGRIGHRNGYKPRTLRTWVGTLNLLVPQDREGTFSTRLFSRYQRNEKALCLALMEMYVEGVSTRKVKEITEELCGTCFSKSLVSSLAGRLDAELQAWRSRRLEGGALGHDHRPSYGALARGARAVHAARPPGEGLRLRVGGRGIHTGVRLGSDERLCCLVMIGARLDGTKKLVALQDGYRESEEPWACLLRDLKKRGMRAPVLAVGDGALGFWAAARDVFPGTRWQRDWVHKTSNVLDALPKSVHARAKKVIQEITQAENKSGAERAIEEFAKEFGTKWPKAVAKITGEKEALLCYYDFPAEHWVHLRTTNPIESNFAPVIPNPLEYCRIEDVIAASFADKYYPFGHRGCRSFSETWYQGPHRLDEGTGLERSGGGDDLQAFGSGRREVAEAKRLPSGPLLVRAGLRFVNGEELVERSEEEVAA